MKQAPPNSKTSALWNAPLTLNQRPSSRSCLFTLSACLLLSGSLACLSAPITISTHGSVGPNRYSSNWTNWWAHAVEAIQSGTDATGNQFADPSAWVERTTFRYIEVIETIDSDPRVTLGFDAWLGIADPSGAAAHELNGALYGFARILGNGSKIALSQYRSVWSDDGGAFSIVFSTAPSQYSILNQGIDYGPDGKLGGGDDVVYKAGAAATNRVDELIVAIGAYYNQTADFPTSPTGLTHQETLNWADDYINKNDGYANSNTMTFSMSDENGSALASASVRFEVKGEPTLYLTKTGNQLSLSWAGSGFDLKTCPALGAPGGWTAVPNSTTSPVTIELSGSKGGFWQLQKQ